MIHIFRRYHSSSEMLDHIVQETGYGVEFSHIFRAMPEMRDLSERLAWRIGDEVKIPLIGLNGPGLASSCLTSGVTWLMESDALTERAPLRDMQTAYAAGLMFLVPELARLQVSVDGLPWFIQDGEDLGACQARGALVTYTRSNEDTDGPGMSGLRMLMLTRLYPDGGHLMLDVDLKQVLWPPASMHPDRNRGEADDEPLD